MGSRGDACCKRLLDKVGIQGHEFLTDDWPGFVRLIPDEQLFTGKDLAFHIEQSNGDIRHHLARFRRRSKVTSKVLSWFIFPYCFFTPSRILLFLNLISIPSHLSLVKCLKDSHKDKNSSLKRDINFLHFIQNSKIS